MNSVCRYMCKYNPTKLDAIRKIVRYLEDKRLDRNYHKKKQHFLWGQIDRCKYGMTCAKIHTYNSEYIKLCQTADALLSAYIDSDDIQDYHTILNMFRGTFPAVYTQFEMLIRKKNV